MKQFYIYEHPSVHIVLEHSFGVVDAKVHGVYSTRQAAEGKVAKLKKKGANGYLCILKKHVEGPIVVHEQYKGQDHYWLSVKKSLK